ncbi:hypothetical protein MDAP_002523 [Mitosporidium daphniae]|uniref:Nucleoporin Nup54 alpha-helical domain-containing protein n=1 Tax=Mitosporidium daphniae TaxID=1485682 RepID=A0A098VRW9_9MICR|nr:uncharacterized protein DI09_6p400 [Mitosporidium daphniae]KGG50456.1 hypothetical protein DI09_6p400 [Mitosporidium daphniae]|eukprot:XP_013236883.1 uncharacterized protein DI09_6p400 [Mitosporidium daphniae]
MAAHPLVLLEHIALSYDVSNNAGSSTFSHVFWNVVVEEGDSERRVPVRVVGFDALHQRAEAQVARRALLDGKRNELLDRLTATLPILTQADLRMEALKRRLRLTGLLILRTFKAMEIIRKHSIPLRPWERSLIEDIEAIMKGTTALARLAGAYKPPSAQMPSILTPIQQDTVATDAVEEALANILRILSTVVCSIHGLHSRLEQTQG